MPNKVKYIANVFGSILAICACILLVREALSLINDQQINADNFPSCKSILAASGLYILAFVALVLAWNMICLGVTREKRFKLYAKINLMSQIAKYLPGNVGHILGRIYLWNRYDLRLRDGNIATAAEIAGTLISGIIVSSSYLFVFEVQPDAFALPEKIASIMFLVAFVSAAALVLRKKLRIIYIRNFSLAIAIYIVVFVLVGFANSLLLFNLDFSGVSMTDVMRVVCAVTVGWVLGFVTPGAPAGIGIRELTILQLLSDRFPDEHILIAVGAFRLINVIGDAVAWLIGLALTVKDDRGPREPA